MLGTQQPCRCTKLNKPEQITDKQPAKFLFDRADTPQLGPCSGRQSHHHISNLSCEARTYVPSSALLLTCFTPALPLTDLTTCCCNLVLSAARLFQAAMLPQPHTLSRATSRGSMFHSAFSVTPSSVTPSSPGQPTRPVFWSGPHASLPARPSLTVPFPLLLVPECSTNQLAAERMLQYKCSAPAAACATRIFRNAGQHKIIDSVNSQASLVSSSVKQGQEQQQLLYKGQEQAALPGEQSIS